MIAANGYYHFPAELYYDRATHLWVRSAGAAATIGLDALGLESLGDMAYVTLPAIGASVQRGAAAGSRGAAKWGGDLMAPSGGTFAAGNEGVLRDPGLINREPYGAGWLLQ